MAKWNVLMILWLIATTVFGCSDDDSQGQYSGSDTNSNTNIIVPSDTDADTDTNGDTNTRVNKDSAGESDADTAFDSDTNLDTDSDEATGIDTGVDTGIDTGSDTGVDTGTGIEPDGITFEESDVCTMDGAIETEHSDVAGDGYINTINASDSTIEWSIHTASTVRVALQWRYALTNGSREGTIFVNGEDVGNLSFDSTGAWETWDITSINADFVAGDNIIALVADTALGLANIDSMMITGAEVTLGTCPLDTDTGVDTGIDTGLDTGVDTGIDTDIAPDDIVAAPNGSESAAGTLNDPTTLKEAISRVSAGKTIFLRGGTYYFGNDETVGLGKNGSSSSPIGLRAYPGDSRPLIDFSDMDEDSSNRGFSISGNYWYIYGLDIYGAGDNGMFISGNYNTIEFCTFYENKDTGLQLANGAANNYILNCDSYFNADSSLENADGFAAKLTVGSGNHFEGCRAWNNLDDGWDGYLRDNNNVTTTYANCWAIDNGKQKNGSVGAGDGNGFKTGGSDDKDLSHNATYTGCIAAGNTHDGFDHNSNRGSVTIINCAAHDNGRNINFSSSNIAYSLSITNTISYDGNSSDSFNATNESYVTNSWQNSISVSSGDFVSVDTALLKAARNPDGSLPDVDYFQLNAGSDLVNAGTNIGRPYNGSAPDLGSFESIF